MQGAPNILVIGSMNVDLDIHGIKKLPQWGESLLGANYEITVGGKGANQAIAAAKMSLKTYLVGRIGKDYNGKLILNGMHDNNVVTDYVHIDTNSHTGISTMNIGPEGKYFSVNSLGANMKLNTTDFEKALADRHFQMIMMQLEMPFETVCKVYDISKKYHIPVFLDAGPAMHIPLEHFKGIFIISPNEIETYALTGILPNTYEKIESAAKYLYKRTNPKYILMKLGGKGVYLFDGNQGKIFPSFSVNAIDTTAAGDTFGAAFAAAFCRDRNIEESIEFGQAAAALCVTRKGGLPSIPSYEETIDFLKRNPIQNGRI